MSDPGRRQRTVDLDDLDDLWGLRSRAVHGRFHDAPSAFLGPRSRVSGRLYLVSLPLMMEPTGKRVGLNMDLTFGSAALETLCNSERRLAQRWGPRRGHTVARRLLDLAAVDLPSIERLPGVSVSNGRRGRIRISFRDGVVVEAIVADAAAGVRPASAEAERMTIVSVDHKEEKAP